jgi:hypothetical protein
MISLGNPGNSNCGILNRSIVACASAIAAFECANSDALDQRICLMFGVCPLSSFLKSSYRIGFDGVR